MSNKVEISAEYKQELRNMMINVGFDFSLVGSNFVFELIIMSLQNKEDTDPYREENITFLADKYNTKIKTVHRLIHWSIITSFDTIVHGKIVDSLSLIINQTRRFLSHLYKSALDLFSVFWYAVLKALKIQILPLLFFTLTAKYYLQTKNYLIN